MTASNEESKTQETNHHADEIQCHSLPCKVDFSGRAPVEVYFSPQLVVGEEGKEEDRIYSAHFRGRQLLSTEAYQHSSAFDTTSNDTTTTTSHRMQGRLLEIDVCQARNSADKIKVKERFGSIMEWKHECEPMVLRNAAAAVDHTSRVRTAMEWCDVAHAVRTFNLCSATVFKGRDCCRGYHVSSWAIEERKFSWNGTNNIESHTILIF